MDIKQTGLILNKINRLFDVLDQSGSVSKVEEDLMKNYVKELYEALLFDNKTSTVETAKVSAPYIEPSPVVEAKQRFTELRKKIIDEPVVTPNPEPVVEIKENVVELTVEPKAVEEIPEPVVLPEPLVEEAPAPPPVFEPVIQKEPEPVVKTTASQEDAELFEHKEATELSDKLSQTPIDNIAKAMGINDKIFIINQLFEGRHEAFDEAIVKLNDMPNFDEAKNYIAKVLAIQFDWLKNDNTKVEAKKFIKLVRRKFS